eukprot:CAMPEP_0174890558 /NCGR_PEP_ID=MMETSP0167-20121228/5710_1 /TAXON_ID=38298 /ORGANISM="Rhodella maculata, Strain CCMP736" /LENGTH=109 /DNA_ID=CAMNT_0016128401 /DNA_START=178 /DNA_END=504 /DNA_ORIENTATION=-
MPPNTFITLTPTFTILDWPKLEPLLTQCVEATKSHAGCLYYGFIKRDNSLECRQAWTDAACLENHIHGETGVAAIMADLEGIATRGEMYVAGPEGEVEFFRGEVPVFVT